VQYDILSQINSFVKRKKKNCEKSFAKLSMTGDNLAYKIPFPGIFLLLFASFYDILPPKKYPGGKP
jgi:hypothetical protein